MAVRRAFMQAAALCAVMFLVCMTVLATDGGVCNLTPQTEAVTIKPVDSSGTEIPSNEGDYLNATGFQIEYGGATDGNAYLLLIMNDQTGVPTKDNLRYIDAADGAEQKAVFSANLGAMKNGTYEVWITDDSKGGDVAKVASYEVYGNGNIGASRAIGDVNDEKGVNINDALDIINHVVGNHILTGEYLEAADVNNEKGVNINDALDIINYVVGNITAFERQ